MTQPENINVSVDQYSSSRAVKTISQEEYNRRFIKILPTLIADVGVTRSILMAIKMYQDTKTAASMFRQALPPDARKQIHGQLSKERQQSPEYKMFLLDA